MTHVQIVLDCTDAVAQGVWWAATLDWHFEWLEPELFEQLKSQGFCTDADVTTVDGNLTWREGAAINSGGERATQQRIYFQAVPEPKVVKNRMHVDVQVGPDHVATTVRSLVARGATELGAGAQGPHHWVVMADPEGNEFCVS
jgi:hypothetical protein